MAKTDLQLYEGMVSVVVSSMLCVDDRSCQMTCLCMMKQAHQHAALSVQFQMLRAYPGHMHGQRERAGEREWS